MGLWGFGGVELQNFGLSISKMGHAGICPIRQPHEAQNKTPSHSLAEEWEAGNGRLEWGGVRWMVLGKVEGFLGKGGVVEIEELSDLDFYG